MTHAITKHFAALGWTEDRDSRPASRPAPTEAPTFRNETTRAVYEELDSLLGSVASVHTLSIRLGISEAKIRSTLSRLRQRGLVDRVDGTPSVWEVVR